MARDSIIELRIGDETGLRVAVLRAGDCKKVFIGDFALGGSSRAFIRCRSAIASAGSGMELSPNSMSSSSESVVSFFLLIEALVEGFSGEEKR